MEKRDELYAGKAKSVYTTDDEDMLIMLFRDDTSAFDGKKKEALARKGAVNNQFNAAIMEKLKAAGIPCHFEKTLSATESLVKKLDMIPVECVVRNIAAGSICRRLGVEEGLELTPPTFEFFLKDDDLGDPMVNDFHIRSFGWASDDQVAQMKTLTFAVNDVLKQLFLDGGMLLVDYWGMNLARMAAACGTRIAAKNWIKTVSVRGWAEWLKPMKKWVSVWE
jgi:phosphoribosylaminoimidazole-succinocarboxamide synthase